MFALLMLTDANYLGRQRATQKLQMTKITKITKFIKILTSVNEHE